MTRNRLLIWAVIILLGLNIATIVSALSYSGRIRSGQESRTEAMTDQRMMFFRDHLQLTDSQLDDFSRINRTFNQNARRTSGRLEMLRREMIDELAATDPDMKRVKDITAEIGSLHQELKMSTANYYLNLKSICNPLQQELLKEMFVMMSDPESNMNDFRRGPMGPGQGGRGRNMRGMGRGMGPNADFNE